MHIPAPSIDSLRRAAARVFAVISIAVLPTLYLPTARAAHPRPVRSPRAALTTPMPAAKATPSVLVNNLRQGVATIGKTIKLDKTFSGKKKNEEPFLAALKKTNRSVTDLAAAMKAKDSKKVFPTLDRTGRAVNELEATWKLTGLSNPTVDGAIKKMTGAYRSLRKSSGKEAQRVRKGGELTAAEKTQIAGYQDRYKKALPALQNIKSKAAGSKFGKSPGKIDQISGLIDSVTALLAGPATTPAYYYDLLYFQEDFAGSWYAISEYCAIEDPVLFASFDSVDTFVVDIETYSETVETSFAFESAEYWESWETSYDVAESYDFAISESEVSSFDTYIEEDISVDISVDEYDITAGDEDISLLDHDDDGIFDGKDDDDDGDGIADAKDMDDDGDGVDDFLEVDADDDGTPDAIDDDDDNDGIDDDADKDDDNDGIADAKDTDNDNDNDGTPDAKDNDDDNDGTPDAKDDDDDGDGIDDADDNDDDNDGVDDDDDADHDDDGDGTPDDADADDDNDGTPDAEDADDDGDGTPDADEDEGDDDGDEGDDPGDDGDDGGDEGEDPGDDGGDDDGDGDGVAALLMSFTIDGVTTVVRLG